MTDTDLLVIGAGPAGYVAAIRAGQLDLDVTLVERDAVGGTCLNHGCIPSKSLITATDVAHDAREAAAMGIHADPSVDVSEMVAWKDGVVDQLTGGVEKLCKANQVSLAEGTATFVDEETVRVAQEDGEAETITFEHALIATGSRPIEISEFSFGDEPVLSSRDALALEEAPDSLVVVGAGYIGMELASVFAKLGTDVTVIEMLDSILPGYPDELTRPVQRRAADLGIAFEFGCAASSWTETDDGICVTAAPADQAAADGGATDLEADETLELATDRVLVAVGREPVTDTLALDAIGLETDDRGFVQTDEQGRTALEHIFAAGDVAGEPMLAHKGSAEGQAVAELVAGESTTVDHGAIPAVVFTDPEIATVGLTEPDAEDAGYEPVTGEFPMRASGRALTMNETAGAVTIVADSESGTILGAGIVAPEASELIAELGLAVELGASLEEVARTIHTHPTLSEAVMEAAENALGHAIHTLNR